MISDINEILDFIKNEPIRISVFGEFSTGKTTFINALIGEEILSVAVDPTTAVPTYIRFAKEFNILVYMKKNKCLKLFEDEPPFWTRFVGRQSVLNTIKKQENEIRSFLKKWTKEGESADEVKNITIELPLQWLKNNLDLIDTPGYQGGVEKHKEHTIQVSKDTDIAIFIISGRTGIIKDKEYDFINKVQKKVSESFIVLNKMDLLDEDDQYDVLDYIKNVSLPKYWEGIIQPKVFSISSLAKLDKNIGKNVPKLVKDFNNLISVIEKNAKENRGKILLDRLGNPEKILFKKGTVLESEKKFDKAHRIYFDLLDILQTAELDTSPAQDGIRRCEEILNDQVNELDDINSILNDVLKKEKNKPDYTLQQLEKTQKRLVAINAPDDEVDKAIERLSKRIKIRDKARADIDSCKNIAETLENDKNLISAVENINKFHNYINDAEISIDEINKLKLFESNLIKQRDEDASIQLNKDKEYAYRYFKKNQFAKAIELIPSLEEHGPYLSKEDKQQSSDLIDKINKNHQEWKDYRKLFTNLKNKFITAFTSNVTSSNIVLDSLNDFKKLEIFAQKFINDYSIQKTISVKIDTILTIDERLEIIEFLIKANTSSTKSKITDLKQKLLKRKDELMKISSASNIWFDNPIYFEKYPDHPTASSSVEDLNIDNYLTFKEAYNILISINAMKGFLTNETKKLTYEKEQMLTEILLKKRFSVFKTKRGLSSYLADNYLFDAALYVADKIGNNKWNS